MTRKEWAALSPQLQWRRVALTAGWFDLHADSWWGYYGHHQEHSPDLRTEVPAYLEDLNAMHEAEKLITDAFVRRRYYQTLDEITGDQWNTIVATAAQRAEAFVLTVEKSDAEG